MQRLEPMEALGLDNAGPLFAVEAIYDEIEHLLDLQRTRLLMEIKAKAHNPPR